jgi:hypothetical protein
MSGGITPLLLYAYLAYIGATFPLLSPVSVLFVYCL